MRILVHVQFLALMLPTVLLLVLAVVSLADLAEGAAYQPVVFFEAAPPAMDAAPPEPAY